VSERSPLDARPGLVLGSKSSPANEHTYPSQL
jgi:hypothetical protein